MAAVALPCAAGIPRVNPIPRMPPSAPARIPGEFTPTKLQTNISWKKVNWKMSSELALPVASTEESREAFSRIFIPGSVSHLSHDIP